MGGGGDGAMGRLGDGEMGRRCGICSSSLHVFIAASLLLASIAQVHSLTAAKGIPYHFGSC
jgi:hypothetical protein